MARLRDSRSVRSSISTLSRWSISCCIIRVSSNLQSHGPPLGVLARDHDPLVPLDFDPDAGYREVALDTDLRIPCLFLYGRIDDHVLLAFYFRGENPLGAADLIGGERHTPPPPHAASPASLPSDASGS